MREDSPGHEWPGYGGWVGVNAHQSGHLWPILRVLRPFMAENVSPVIGKTT